VIDFPAALGALSAARVEFILTGGVAATVHGSARLSQELELVYARDARNIERLVAALAPHAPGLREAPPELPFRLDVATVRRGLNFTLSTALGDVALLGEVAGGGSFEQLLPHTVRLELFGTRCLCLALPKLIAVQRAAGRAKDYQAVAELEALLEESTRA
jgi:hypothetical protein